MGRGRGKGGREGQRGERERISEYTSLYVFVYTYACVKKCGCSTKGNTGLLLDRVVRTHIINQTNNHDNIISGTHASKGRAYNKNITYSSLEPSLSTSMLLEWTGHCRWALFRIITRPYDS